MDMTYEWIETSTYALFNDFCISEPSTIFFGSVKAHFLGPIVSALVDSWDDIQERIESMIPF